VAESFARTVGQITDSEDSALFDNEIQVFMQTLIFAALCSTRGFDPHDLLINEEARRRIHEETVARLREVGAEPRLYEMTDYEPPKQ
jgi:hypothetical protein